MTLPNNLPMHLIWDLVLGLILISILYNSWRRGFITSFVRLAGAVVSFLLASFVSRPAARQLYDRFLEARVQEYVQTRLMSAGSPLMEALAGLDQAGEAAAEALSGFLEEWGFDFFSADDAHKMGSDILEQLTQGADPSQTIAQVAVRPLVVTVLEIAIFLLVFFVAGMVVKLIAGLGLGVNHIPLVGGLNRTAGLLCGAVYALLVGWVVANVLVFFAGIGGNQWQWLNGNILRRTHLIKWLLDLRPFLP